MAKRPAYRPEGAAVANRQFVLPMPAWQIDLIECPSVDLMSAAGGGSSEV